MAKLTVTVVSKCQRQHVNHGPIIMNLDLTRGTFWTMLPDLGLERFPKEVIVEDEGGAHLFTEPMHFHNEEGVTTAAYYRTLDGPAAWRLAIYRDATRE